MRLRHRIASHVRLAALLLLLGIMLSPLRAVAATLPTLIAYDVAVRSTATTTLGERDAVRPEVARGRTACDDATFAYDDSSNRPTAAGVGGILPYDDALNFGERREVGEGAISVVPAATAAAEGATEAMTTLYRGVMPAELADIEETGQLINRGSAEGKYFSLDPEGVSSYAKQAVSGFGDPPYTMVQTQIPTRLLTPEMAATVDRGVRAVVVPNGLLPGLTPTVSPFMVVP